MAAWMVWGGTRTEEALDTGILALDYDVVEDIREMDKLQIRSLLLAKFPDKTAANTKYAGWISSFKDDIRIGDVVLMPRKNSGLVAVGEVSGDYKFLSERSDHTIGRPVRWANSAISRDGLGNALYEELRKNVRQTVHKFKGTDAETQLRTIASIGSGSDSWTQFVRRAKAYIDAGNPEKEYLNNKRGTGQKLTVAREAVLHDSEGWQRLVLRGIAGNLIFSSELIKFREWINSAPGDASNALQAMWTQNALSVSERMTSFCRLVPQEASGSVAARTRLGSVLLMGVDAGQYPPFGRASFDKAYRLTSYEHPEQDASEATLYSHALGFLDRFIEEGNKRNLPVHNRLDAQSLVWAVAEGLDEQEPALNLSASAKMESVRSLADDLFLPVSFLQEILKLLEDKRQVIFQGPPGTGKTYVAQKLAQHLAGNDQDRVRLVQFHPSYAYEDFVQGFRPRVSGDGQAVFDLRNGPLVQTAEKARRDPDNDHYLIIDEINRGNLAKVFGELYFLLEYRNHEMSLQYSDELFSLPENLHIIGTMNTADRSIALVDLALRRRFHFMEFKANESPIKDVLRKWLAQWAPDMAWIAGVVDRANELLNDQDAAIGPSYFMNENLDEDLVRLIWEHNVMPYIAERLFGQRDLLPEFALDRLRNARGDDSQAGHAETEDIADAGSGENDAAD